MKLTATTVNISLMKSTCQLELETAYRTAAVLLHLIPLLAVSKPTLQTEEFE